MGTVALVVFIGTLFLVIKGYISQKYFTIQTSLLLAGLIIILIGLFFGIYPDISEFGSLTQLHPITATISGFITAGALKAAGGFEAAADLLKRAEKSFLGLSFAVILLVNLPTVLAMPCGRIIVSALIPVALLFGYTASEESKNKNLQSMIMFGLIINAAASCAPSLIGGIGTMGEGMGGYAPGSFSDSLQIGIIVITTATMAMIKYFFKMKVDVKVPSAIAEKKATQVAYISLSVFLFGLALIVILQPAIPLQVILLLIILFIMLISRLSIKNLISNIMIHPLTAMLAGFIIAGILSKYGAFTDLMKILNFIAHNSFFGLISIAVVIMYAPIIFPLPCGRILAISLIPAILILGSKLSVITNNSNIQAVITSGFILSAAASCGPSPLGGIGCIGEGNLRLKPFSSSKPQVFGTFLGVPITCIIISNINFSTNDPVSFYVILAFSIAAGLFMNKLLDLKLLNIGGILGGVVLGVLLKLF